MIRQPGGSRLCGQVAVAIIAGITLEEAVEVVGHRKSTHTRELVAAFRSLGFQCADRLQRIPRPPLAVAKLTPPSKSSGWHWVVVDGRRTLDGFPGDPTRTPGWRITSYLPLERP